jgi:DNA-binding transcriptional MerR regulator
MERETKWVPPQNCDSRQLSLFPITLGSLCEETEASAVDLLAWREEGLLSFDPGRSDPFQPYEVAEARFVGGLRRSGLSHESIETLFAKLDKPYQVDPETTAYSFALERWVRIAQNVASSEIVDRYLDALEDEEDVDGLVQLANRVVERLAALAGKKLG